MNNKSMTKKHVKTIKKFRSLLCLSAALLLAASPYRTPVRVTAAETSSQPESSSPENTAPDTQTPENTPSEEASTESGAPDSAVPTPPVTDNNTSADPDASAVPPQTGSDTPSAPPQAGSDTSSAPPQAGSDASSAPPQTDSNVQQEDTPPAGNTAVSGGQPDANVTETPELTAMQGTFYVISQNTLNIRSGPSTKHEVIGTLKHGDQVTATGQTSDGWYQVSYNGSVGYVSSQYLSESVPPAASETPDASFSDTNLPSEDVTQTPLDETSEPDTEAIPAEADAPESSGIIGKPVILILTLAIFGVLALICYSVYSLFRKDEDTTEEEYGEEEYYGDAYSEESFYDENSYDENSYEENSYDENSYDDERYEDGEYDGAYYDGNYAEYEYPDEESPDNEEYFEDEDTDPDR